MKNDVTEVPVFGTRVEGRSYTVRPSAYVVVRNAAGEIAVVRTPRGYFLPGGGIEPGETARQAAAREAIEEAGLVLGPFDPVGDAVEFVYSPDENTWFEKASVFLAATVAGLARPTEPDHHLVWLDPDRAIEALSHEGHRWAAGRLMARTRA